MSKNEICDGCGKLIDSNFFYCPWCGNCRTNGENKKSRELRYRQLQVRRFEDRKLQIEKMAEELNTLEQELSILVLSAEMAK